MSIKIIALLSMAYLGIANISVSTYAEELMTWEALDQQVIALYNEGNFDYAIAIAKTAVVSVEETLGPEHPSVATVLNNFATVYYAQGRYDEAEPLYKRALNIKQRAFGPNHLDVAQGMNNLATLYYAQGKYEDAEPLYRRALEIREEILGSEHPDVAKSLNNLGVVYRTQALQVSVQEAGEAPPAAVEPPKKELLPETPSINVEELYTRITKGRDTIILDIRENDEISKKYIPNSIRFPRDKIGSDEDHLKNVLSNTNRGAVIAVFSSNVADADRIVIRIRSWGHRAYNVEGSFAAWEEHGYPVSS
ncbi:MAG: tetratricopeptide repeat protein [Candidatus Orphnella occulta]|nr:tetratricopeptide repeat protein [Candidatus Orphnella occulta]